MRRRYTLFDHDLTPGKEHGLLLGFIVLVSVSIYILTSWLYYRVGFPLDDSWIHQTYARNLAMYGEWSFLPGQPSAGSTAPLWTALLTPGHLFGLGPFIWTYLLSGFLLLFLAIVVENTMRTWMTNYTHRFPWVGFVIVLEWHLVWATCSGMETLLFTLLATLILVRIILRTKNDLSLGLLIGLCSWVRPDGLTLLGPAILAVVIRDATGTQLIRNLLKLAIGVGGLFALYILFNLILGGTPFPNTYYAKQIEYSVYLQTPFIQRIGLQILQPLVGVGIVIVPGYIYALATSIKQRNWGILIASVWLLGYLGIYAWRLPVLYQHGRYAMPVIPLILIIGIAGVILIKERLHTRAGKLITSGWQVAISSILIIFWLRGAYAYAQDVAVIESEMVTVAKWVSDNIPEGSLVAAHDIGALGYFGRREIVDLAGLISPAVIQFLRDERQLAEYLNKTEVNYLISFPDWYPSLTAGLESIFTSEGQYAPLFGEQNMVVYRWVYP